MELVYTIDLDSIYIKYTVMDEDTSKKDIIGVTVFLPENYAKTYNFSHILLTLGNLRKPFDIKEVFFKILKQLPGDISEYSNICVLINNDRFRIGNGHLIDYYDESKKERISATESDDDNDIIYNYYREYNSRQHIFISDLFNDDKDYCDNQGLSEVTVRGIKLYAQSFISDVESKIKGFNNNKGKIRVKGKKDA